MASAIACFVALAGSIFIQASHKKEETLRSPMAVSKYSSSDVVPVPY